MGLGGVLAEGTWLPDFDFEEGVLNNLIHTLLIILPPEGN